MSTRSRFPGQPGQDNTSRILNNEVQTPAYASSIAIIATKANTLINVGQLTGALSLTIGVGSGSSDDNPPFVGDKVEFLFAADGTNRVVTFSTGFASPGTLTVVASKYGKASFTFNGAVWIGSGVATA